MNNKSLIEGLLFMAGEDGLSLVQLQSVLPDHSRQEISAWLQELKEDLDRQDRGIELVYYGGRYKLLSRQWVYPYAQKLFETLKSVPLSAASMETLAIIAYRQPITRVEIEEIRGVGCDMILKKLLARGLIQARDRLDTVGKPLLYTVTDEFLDAFELESLQDLPQLPESQENQDLFESR